MMSAFLNNFLILFLFLGKRNKLKKKQLGLRILFKLQRKNFPIKSLGILTYLFDVIYASYLDCGW